MKDTLECYKILDVEPGASAARVRSAYLALAHAWDPERYVGNPKLRAEAARKRAEIEDAYQSIRFFLPELQSLPGMDDELPMPRVRRDFKEMARQTSTETSKALMGFLVALVLFATLAWGFYLILQSRNLAPNSPAATS